MTDVKPSFPFEIVTIPDSNYRKGRKNEVPVGIVLHIVEGSKQSCIATFKDPTVKKSSHFLVGKDGSIVQFVSTADTAFCNGIVEEPINEIVLKKMPLDPNIYTLSIEHEGYGTSDITAAQYASTSKIVAFLGKKWNIPLDRTHVLAHREIRVSKTCPGLLSVEKVIRMARKVIV